VDNGRIERVNLNQWANPCAGVTQRASLPDRREAIATQKPRV